MFTIKTPSLTLRPIQRDDAPTIAHLCNDETLIRNTSRLPFPYTLTDAEAFVEMAQDELNADKEYRFAICENGILVACAGIMRTGNNTFELGYWVGHDARGRGIATQGARAVCQFGFSNQHADKISAGHFVDNPASGRILEKLGFQKTGETLPTFSRGRGEDVETIRYSMTPAEFVPTDTITIKSSDEHGFKP